MSFYLNSYNDPLKTKIKIPREWKPSRLNLLPSRSKSSVSSRRKKIVKKIWFFSFESRRNGYRSEWESHREVERSSPTPFAWFFSLWYPEIASSCTLLWSIFPLIRLVYRHLHRAALRRVGHHLRNSSFLSLILSLLERVCVFFSPVAIPLLLRLEAWAVRDPRWRRRKSCQPQIWTWCACVCVCSCIALAGRQLFPLFTSRCRRRSAASIGARHAALRTCCRLRRTSWWRAWRRRCRNTNDPDICCACTWSAGLRWGCRWWRAVPRRPTGGRRAGTPRLRCPVGSAPFAAAPLRWTSPVASCPPPLGSSTPGWWSPQQLLLPSSFIIFQIQFDTLDSAYCGPTILLVTTSYDHNTWKTLDIFP